MQIKKAEQVWCMGTPPYWSATIRELKIREHPLPNSIKSSFSPWSGWWTPWKRPRNAIEHWVYGIWCLSAATCTGNGSNYLSDWRQPTGIGGTQPQWKQRQDVLPNVYGTFYAFINDALNDDLSFQSDKLVTPARICIERTKESALQQMCLIGQAATEAQRKEPRAQYGLSNTSSFSAWRWSFQVRLPYKVMWPVVTVSYCCHSNAEVHQLSAYTLCYLNHSNIWQSIWWTA